MKETKTGTETRKDKEKRYSKKVVSKQTRKYRSKEVKRKANKKSREIGGDKTFHSLIRCQNQASLQ